MNTICDIKIDFPELEAVSRRQLWYAKSLREAYIQDNYERFEEISNIVESSIDERLKDGIDGYETVNEASYGIIFTDEEMAVLFCNDAHGVIAALKNREWRYEHEENRSMV